MDKKISDILKDLKELCKKYDSVLPDEKYLSKLDNLEYIVVGDNPGEEEYKQRDKNNHGEYFIGPHTRYIRHLFESAYGNDDYKKHVLFLNKTPIFTKNTVELKEIRENQNFQATQKEMVGLIKEISQKTNAPIWIMGVSWIKKNSSLKSTFKGFREEILADLELEEKCCLFYHPSRGCFLEDLKDALKLDKPLTQSEFECRNFSMKDLGKLTDLGKGNFKHVVRENR